MQSEHDLKPLITRALGAIEAERTLAFQAPDLEILGATAQQLMNMTPPSIGACVLMSAAWALHLREKYEMPAVAVAGDLRIAGKWVFRATDPLPEFRQTGQVIKMTWKGHCWVEVGGYICDASIFRTVYRMTPDNVARQFFEGTFGAGRGAFLIKQDQMPDGLRYRRRAVLNQNQMVGFFDSLRYVIEGGKPN